MHSVVAQLRERGIDFEDGLPGNEVSQIEARYEFDFPPDLREFLSVGLPVSVDFPNWRMGYVRKRQGEISIAQALEWPANSLSFDVEHNQFWNEAEDATRRNSSSQSEVCEAPRLIPVFAHRFLPSEPCLDGNLVLSVWQTDVVYYGLDLASYLAREFGLSAERAGNGNKTPRRIRFWSDIVEQCVAEFGPERSDA
jgi:hypothetical protein